MSNKKKILPSRPYLTNISNYNSIIKKIWKTKVVSNNGPILKEFENKITKFFSLKYFSCTSSGTCALQIAIKSLNLKGEIITPAFGWIATVNAIKSQNCKPVFCDIEKDTLNIDTFKLEKLINTKTVAIMPVHTFGNPCNIEKIQKIAKKHKLKVIYDSAHALGSKYKNKNILKYGDISTISLHATKLINTGEGGGCITNNIKIHKAINSIRSFGFDENKNLVRDGFNGKMSEINAALGLANFKDINHIFRERKLKYLLYLDCLSNCVGVSFQKINFKNSNFSYFPIIFENKIVLNKILKIFNKKNIFPRRYFHPSLNTLRYLSNYKKMGVSEDISSRIICLPLYTGISKKDIRTICDIILKNT